MASLYDSWGVLDKMHYNPDGSMKPDYKQLLLDKGMSSGSIAYLEDQKKNEVRLFEEREQRYLERHGIPYSEWVAQNQSSKADLESRQRKAIRNGEEISSLPMDIDPDDYYKQVGNAGLY